MDVVEKENKPTTAIDRFSPKKNSVNKSLTVKEVESIKEESYSNARNYALVAVLATTGMRISEAIGMNWNDIFRQDAEEGEGYAVIIYSISVSIAFFLALFLYLILNPSGFTILEALVVFVLLLAFEIFSIKIIRGNSSKRY